MPESKVTYGREVITPDQRADAVDRMNTYMGVFLNELSLYCWYDPDGAVVHEEVTRKGEEFPYDADQVVTALHPGSQPFVVDRESAGLLYRHYESIIE